VQAARELVGAARILVELAAGMQHGEGDLDHRHTLFRVQPHRNAAPVVLHRNGTVQMCGHRDIFGIARQRLVACVVDDFRDQVVGIHAGALAHRFKTA
jgi:hypothetical protein